MDELALAPLLKDIGIGPVRSYHRIGSTNDEASLWIDESAPDLALIVADEQTAGKGRQGRHWFTPPSAALAFSLVLRADVKQLVPTGSSLDPAWAVMRMTALGALAVCEALHDNFALPAQIKWPNDVLLNRRKVAGILAEAHWQGNHLQAVILGIGINIAPLSVPPDEVLIYPATCVQEELGRPVDRFDLLHLILESLLQWRSRIGEPVFVQMWDSLLAYKGEWVNLLRDDQGKSPVASIVQVLGLDGDGRLLLKDSHGEEFSLITGELRLRPLNIDLKQ